MWQYKTDELYHYGVLGMKWGKRKGSVSSGTRPKKQRYSDDAKAAKQIQKKKVRQMSNAELKKVNERKQLEQTYSNQNKSSISKGMKFVAGAATFTGTVLTLYNNSDKLITVGKKFVGK